MQHKGACKLIIYIFIVIFLTSSKLFSINEKQVADSVQKAKELLEDATVKSAQKEIEITIRNVDITKFPDISIIVEAFNIFGQPLDTLLPEKLTIVENGVEKKVISVKKISVHERVPVDFVFIIDKTGSMQKYIDAVKSNVQVLMSSLVKRGIDYRLGLVLFSDAVEKRFPLTDNVNTFLSWINPVVAERGGDEPENALEAIRTAAEFKFRPSANKVGIILTDAPYHQAGEKGDGTTDFTTESMIKFLKEKEFRLFTITPPRLNNYRKIASKTRGNTYDIEYPFSNILDNFSNQLTNLFALKYMTNQPAIPDSINIALLNEKKQELVHKVIPIVELGRKLIIENLLYKTNSAELSMAVPELEVLTEFLTNKQNVRIMVEGHTDDRGSDKLNDRLSLLRAESVKRYLIKKNIAATRIKTTGFGKRRPIADNTTDFGRSINRRTEIVILSK